MNIIIPEGRAPVYCRYEGQFKAQPAYIVIKPEEEILTVDCNYEIGNAIPAFVFYGRILWYNIPEAIKREELIKILNDIVPLADRVVRGYTTCWDGSNLRGELDEDAKDANEEINSICQELWEDWYLCFPEYNCEEYIIDIIEIDELWKDCCTLDEVVNKVHNMADADGILLYGNEERAIVNSTISYIEKSGSRPTESQIEAIKCVYPYFDFECFTSAP